MRFGPPTGDRIKNRCDGVLVAPAALLQRREERPGPQLRDRSSRSPAVVVRCTGGNRCAGGVGLGALVRAGADHRGELSLINAWQIVVAADRIRSSTSAAFSACSTSSRADWSKAIVCCLLPREPLAWSR